jgi:hypothetical protein
LNKTIKSKLTSSWARSVERWLFLLPLFSIVSIVCHSEEELDKSPKSFFV